MTVFIPCIDPGHGGADLGAVCPAAFGSAQDEFREKDLNLEIAKKLDASFAGTRIVPALTRQADFDPSWAARYKTAKDAGAQFVVSIHGNANRSPEVRGAEAYHYPSNQVSRRVCQRWLASMPPGLRTSKVFAATDRPGPDDDWLQRPLTIIKAFRELPVAVAEYAYLSNEWDAGYIQSPWALDMIVSALRVAVVEAARLYS